MIDVNVALSGSDVAPKTRVLICGDSTYAAHLGQQSVASFVFTNDDVVYGCTCYSQAAAGETILQQQEKWEDDTEPWKYDVILLAVGLNDLDPNEDADVALLRMQNFIDSVRNLARSDAKIVINTMTPCRSTLINIYGPTDGPIAYQKWLDMNTAYMGGTNAITGVDFRQDAHTAALNDGSGNLAPEYEITGTEDGIHENDAGRAVIATYIRESLTNFDLYVPS